MKIILTESQFNRVILKESTNEKYPNCYELDKRKKYTPPVKPNAGDIQKFLQEVGEDIGPTGVDYDFGDNSAKAFANFWYKGYKNINTLSQLYDKLKSDGYDVGAKSGKIFGVKMSNIISNLLSKWVVKYSSIWCKAKVKEIVDKNENSQKEFCLNNKDKALGEIKTLWLNWANHPATSEKLSQQFKSQGLNPLLFLKEYLMSFKYEINSFKSSQLYCRTELEDNKLYGSVAYQEGDKIVLNCDTTKINTYEGMKNTLNHEFSHYLEHKVEYINDTEYWKKSLPLLKKGWDINKSRSFSQWMLNITNTDELIDGNIISRFKNIGVSKSDLSYWLNEVKNYGEDYNCRQTEKESNLKSIKLYYCKNLYCDLEMKQIKEMLIYKNLPQEVKGDAYQLMMCWATNEFNPSPKEFLNGLNDLALVDGDVENDNVT